MQTAIITGRLTLGLLSIYEGDFMLELVNSKGWLEFIGNRSIYSRKDAITFIQKIKNTPDLEYWVVKLTSNNVPVGIISFLKRVYLEHYDIGFALLPEFSGKGYAYEAAREILLKVINNPAHTHILATTVPANVSSIRLLKKLGLQFDKEIEVDRETLHIYSNSTDSLKRINSNTIISKSA